MGYTALDKMREINCEKYGVNGPNVPLLPTIGENNDLEQSTLVFLREDCEDLRFRAEGQYRNLADLEGKSCGQHQIPLHMEFDLDRLCLERSMHRFFQSGLPQDAFDVYFCYMEMFFQQKKASARSAIELLSEFEKNASALLLSHRDHYVHSVYVFALGLALYHNSPIVRKTYQDYYGLESDRATAHHFLEHWGVCALFHDIGYPFELAYVQVQDYFGDNQKNAPYVSYRNVEKYAPAQKYMEQMLNETERSMLNRQISSARLFAANTTNKIYSSACHEKEYHKYLKNNNMKDSPVAFCRYLTDIIVRKPSRPNEFENHMDHALFSATILLNRLPELLPEKRLNPQYADVLTAILLHNSLYKYSICNGDTTEALQLSTHPLAYLLMLCDELQCWNRQAYGKRTRQENAPFDCKFKFLNNQIEAVYQFDKKQLEAKDKGIFDKLRRNAEHTCSFQKALEEMLSLGESGSLSLDIRRAYGRSGQNNCQTLSESSFMHLYLFAVSLNAQYQTRSYDISVKRKDLAPSEMEQLFENLSLEYKLSNIAQAKEYAKHLERIGCFFSDRSLSLERKTGFSIDEIKTIGEAEHKRWEAEKREMGWQSGNDYRKYKQVKRWKAMREQTRMHEYLGVDFVSLPPESQEKDMQPIRDMQSFMEKYDGVQIYKIPSTSTGAAKNTLLCETAAALG